jgi:GNAT superfamily N-acetyltransferase
MVRMDCKGAVVVEVPTVFLASDAAKAHAQQAARDDVARRAQDQAYLPFMGRAVLDRFRSGEPNAYSTSWEEGGPRHFFVALVGDAVVGMTDLQSQSDGWALVEPMYVLPECQGQGVGTKLWKYCLDVADNESARGLRVVALDENKIGTHFYALTLKLPIAGAEVLNVGDRSFTATRYEIAI